MLSTLGVIFPVFALIFSGFIARKTNILSAITTRELSRFVVYLALPAVLIDITAKAHWNEIYQPGFIAAFGLGCMAVFIFSLALDYKKSLADSAINGVSAAYANTAFMGFPLCLAVFGEASLIPVMVASIITVCILFAIAIILIEFSVQTDKNPLRLTGKVLLALLKNPLVIAPLIGTAIAVSGLGVPAPLEAFLKLLGAAASPCALVSIGLFLAEKRPDQTNEPATATRLVLFKLFAQPAITYVLAFYVFELETMLAHMAVVIAALATGTGPFMLAERYNRNPSLSAQVIFLTTVFSVITVTAYISFMV